MAIPGNKIAQVDRRSTWAARRDVVLTIVGWLAVAWVLFGLLGRISHTLFILVLAALLAYMLAPAIRRLERVLPRFAAVLLVYLMVLDGLGGLLYLVISAALTQIESIVPTVQGLLVPGDQGGTSPTARALERAGVSNPRIVSAGQQLTGQVEHLTGSILPIL